MSFEDNGISKSQLHEYNQEWEKRMKGEKALFANNPMPKTHASVSPFAGSNGTFVGNNRGKLGIRYWHI